jgi:hypothetical protein
MLLPQGGEQKLGRINISFNGLDGMLGNKGYADCRCKVENAIHIFAQRMNQFRVRQIGLYELQIGVTGDFGEIGWLAGRVIIDHSHPITALK